MHGGQTGVNVRRPDLTLARRGGEASVSGGGTFVLRGDGPGGESIGSGAGCSCGVVPGWLAAHVSEGGISRGAVSAVLDADAFFNDSDSGWNDGGGSGAGWREGVNAIESGGDVRTVAVDVGMQGDYPCNADLPTGAPGHKAGKLPAAPGEQDKDDEWYAHQAARLQKANEEARQRLLSLLTLHPS